MTQAAIQLEAIGPQPRVLRVVNALALRQHRIKRWGDLCRGTWTILAALLLAIIIDAAIPLHPWLRFAATIGIILLPGISLTRRWRQGGDATEARLGEAQRMEQRLGVPGNQLINGVALASLSSASTDGVLVQALAGRAADRADRVLASVPPRRALDRRSLRVEAIRLLAVAAFWLVIGLALPRLLTGGVVRFVMPFADQPPFSWTVFDVSVQPDGTVPFAGDARVSVTLTGKRPLRVELVEMDDTGREQRRSPMRQGSSGDAAAVHEHGLQSMTQSAWVFVESETGRSRRRRIQVAAPPAVDKKPDPSAAQPADGVGSADPARVAATKAAALADAAQRIRAKAAELASRLESLAPDQPMPDWMKEQLQQLRDDIEQFTGRSQSLEELLRELMKAQQGRLSQDAQLLKSLTDLADDLRATKLSGVKGQRLPSKSQAGRESRDAEKAAGEDLKNLKGGMADLDRLLGGVTALSGPVTPPVLITPEAAGTADSQVRPGTQHDLSPAVLRVVPEQYRELVARYFDRLAKDGGK